MTEPTPFVCPRCGAKSYHPMDKEHGYCARCHDFTRGDTMHTKDMLAAALREVGLTAMADPPDNLHSRGSCGS